ncbi:MAG: cytochrome b5-like heme/steroid binding domain-containing protein [Nesterenkonia sp.]|uniref:cytochrome b5-like heme/steroid binding domain-containing protein n=1 Tax=Nesterenkonia marinintestina TaxID=2979865 RepID=UPI0021BF3091|nr:cytochrome b5-like heme/steroid binding domain-containing protein [Nesterenkonia sp. GX14115]MDO5492398.1 cytochrome b5-like heme/steroid binding domain-containing protein [Nesterenkonia sp.]
MDLPIHPLAAHLPVVLIPLSSIMLILAVTIRPLRRHLMLVAVVLVGMGAAGAFLAMQTGEQLAETVGDPEAHSRWGLPTFLTAAALTVVAAAWAWTTWRAGRAVPAAAEPTEGAPRPRPSPLGAVLGTATVVLAVTATALTVMAGHSGAEEVWSDTEEEADAAEDEGQEEEDGQEADGDVALTMEEVSEHDSSDSCWAAVDGTVYDLTDWVPDHPGGEQAIEGLCGTDATEDFRQQHGGQSRPEDQLAQFELGPLD